MMCLVDFLIPNACPLAGTTSPASVHEMISRSVCDLMILLIIIMGTDIRHLFDSLQHVKSSHWYRQHKGVGRHVITSSVAELMCLNLGCVKKNKGKNRKHADIQI
jgi:hypothetical protein